jgi:hypothetical protein
VSNEVIEVRPSLAHWRTSAANSAGTEAVRFTWATFSAFGLAASAGNQHRGQVAHLDHEQLELREFFGHKLP